MENTTGWVRKPRSPEEKIGEWLGSSDLHALLTAMEMLERQGPAADSLLRPLVQHDAQKYREGKRQLRLGVTLIVLLALAIFCWNIICPGIAGGASGGLLLTIWLASPYTLSWYEDHRTYGRRLSNAVALLHRAPSPTATAEMIEALDVGDARAAAVAAQSLIQILPNLTDAESARLQPKHHLVLRHALRGTDSALLLAILHASDKILNPAAIPNVRCLLHCPDWIADSEKIQAAARLSLTILQADARHRHTVKTSLRASSPPDSPAEELLRPAAFVPAGAAHQMLRADSAPQYGVPPEQVL